MLRGKEIDEIILKTLSKNERPVSTRDIALKIRVSWHPVLNHCLRLQMAGKVDGFRVGNMNLWVIKR